MRLVSALDENPLTPFSAVLIWNMDKRQTSQLPSEVNGFPPSTDSIFQTLTCIEKGGTCFVARQQSISPPHTKSLLEHCCKQIHGSHNFATSPHFQRDYIAWENHNGNRDHPGRSFLPTFGWIGVSHQQQTRIDSWKHSTLEQYSPCINDLRHPCSFGIILFSFCCLLFLDFNSLHMQKVTQLPGSFDWWNWLRRGNNELVAIGFIFLSRSVVRCAGLVLDPPWAHSNYKISHVSDRLVHWLIGGNISFIVN